jgi:hypothetical protein
LTCPVAVSPFLAISRWIIASVVDSTENGMFHLVMIWLRNVPHQSSHLLQVLMPSSHRSCVRTCETQHVFRSSDTILWHVLWLITAAATSLTIWERLAHTNIATFWIWSSVLTVLGRPICSSPSKLSLPCAKHLCHLNAIAQGLLAVRLFDHLKHFANGFA